MRASVLAALYILLLAFADCRMRPPVEPAFDLDAWFRIAVQAEDGEWIRLPPPVENEIRQILRIWLPEMQFGLGYLS
jgi:hypothetical protein